jgi:DHA2 family multidrug resistance protein-like MFS transporter
VAAAAWFVGRQRRLASPFIDLALFANPRFVAALVAYLLATFVAFGSSLFMSQYLQLVLGLSPLHAGLWTLPWAGGFILGSNLTPPLARRVAATTLMWLGLMVAALGFAVLTRLDGRDTLPLFVAGSVLFSVGLAPVFTLGTDIIVGAARPEQAGAAAAISEISSELGGAVGIAFLGSIGTAVYRGTIVDRLPAGLSPSTVDAARNTLAGALEAAAPLPDAAGRALAQAAHAAFVDALTWSMVTCAAIAAATALLVALLLRRREAPAAQAV